MHRTGIANDEHVMDGYGLEVDSDIDSPLPKARILIVDDHRTHRLALQALLESKEHEVVGAESGEEALALLQSSEFALVLLDVEMPSMDGLETARRIRSLSLDAARRVPILFITAVDVDDARVAAGYAHGAVDFLHKPIELDVVRSKVATFVALHQVKVRLAAEREAAKERASAFEARLQALTDLALGLSEATTREQVTSVILEHGARVARGDICTLYAVDKSGTSLELLGHRGVAPDVIDKIRRITESSGSAPTLRAMRAGEAIWAENPAEYEAIFPSLAAIKTAEKRASAFWSMPLIASGRPIGVLGMGFYEARTFSAAERAFASTFAKHCAQALQRALLFEREEENRRWFSTTLQSIGDAVIATDPEGRITFMNPVAERLTGWTEHDALGHAMDDVFQIFSEASGEKVESPVAKVLREGAVVGLANHTILRAKNGVEIPIDDSGAPIRDERGRLFGVVLVFRDVTLEKRAEKRRAFLARAADTLISSLDYRETLTTVARLAVPELADWCTVDVVEDGVSRQLAVAHADPAKVAYAHELGQRYPADPKAKSGAPNVIRTGKSELFVEIPDAVLERGARDEEHLRILRALRLESAMVVPFPARDGRTLGAMTFIHAASGMRYSEEDLAFAEDFAKRAAMAIENAQALKEVEDARARERALREHAEVASTAKDQFLATVSHELRTPLNAILGWTMILRRRAPPVETDNALRVIERNARAQARLIGDVLDVSRITSGKLTLALGPVDVGEALREAIQTVRPAAEAKEIAIVDARIAVGPRMTILADADRLQQIFWNLLTNALKFTPKGGIVEVSAERAGSEVTIAVVDSGEGIEPEALPFVFDLFRQADSSTTRRHGGLGLGLTLVRQLTTAHGGVVSAASTGPGQGATFTVRLPARAMAPAILASTRRAPTRSDAGGADISLRLDGLVILVVDDEEDARNLIGEMFREVGAVVHFASSAEEGEAQVKNVRPDVIVSDIGMPHADGHAFLRRVRAMPQEMGGRTPAIALTAYSRVEDGQRALAAGFQRHVTKPVAPADLIAIVANLCGRTAPVAEG